MKEEVTGCWEKLKQFLRLSDRRRSDYESIPEAPSQDQTTEEEASTTATEVEHHPGHSSIVTM